MYLAMVTNTTWWQSGSADTYTWDGPIQCVLRRLEMLVGVGIIPWVVFDGAVVPLKKDTIGERNTKRDAANKALAEYLLEDGSEITDDTAQKLIKSLARRHPQFTRQLISNLAQYGYHYIVAPYEADHQCVYLNRIGVVDAVLSGDGDVAVLGAKEVIYDCPTHRIGLVRNCCFSVRAADVVTNTVHPAHNHTATIYDFGDENDTASEEDPGSSDDDEALPAASASPTKTLSISDRICRLVQDTGDFSGVFIRICCLMGCDYFKGFEGIGPAKAEELVAAAWKDKDDAPSMRDLFQSAHKKVGLVRSYKVQDVLRAEDCFRHQIVYDPLMRRRVCFSSSGPDHPCRCNRANLLSDAEAKRYRFGNQPS